MTVSEAYELRTSLAAELAKADTVIAVMEAHLRYLPEYDRKRLAEDLHNRGLGDHRETRAELLREVYR
jgi:hypothetical protein